VVIWDKIIRRGESAVLELNDMKAKYYFFDDGHGLRLASQLLILLYFCYTELTRPVHSLLLLLFCVVFVLPYVIAVH